jgi:uncharacterized protein
MSQAALDVVRSIWTVFGRGGFPDTLFDQDVEWHTAPDLPDGGADAEPLRGPDAVRQMLASGWETVEAPWLKVDEYLDCGDQIVVTWRGGGTSRVGRVPVEWHESHVYGVREGKVRRVQEYRTRDEALEAVGEAGG